MAEPQGQTTARWSAYLYVAFLGVVLLVAGTLILMGYLVARGQGKPDWLPALAGGCVVSALASALAGALLTVRGGKPTAALNRFLIAMLGRLALVALLATVAVLGFNLALEPFMAALVVSYLAFLAVDTVFAVQAARSL